MRTAVTLLCLCAVASAAPAPFDKHPIKEARRSVVGPWRMDFGPQAYEVRLSSDNVYNATGIHCLQSIPAYRPTWSGTWCSDDDVLVIHEHTAYGDGIMTLLFRWQDGCWIGSWGTTPIKLTKIR